MGAIQEISVRIGRVIGHSIAGNMRRYYPRWLTYFIVGLLVIANVPAVWVSNRHSKILEAG